MLPCTAHSCTNISCYNSWRHCYCRIKLFWVKIHHSSQWAKICGPVLKIRNCWTPPPPPPKAHTSIFCRIEIISELILFAYHTYKLTGLVQSYRFSTLICFAASTDALSTIYFVWQRDRETDKMPCPDFWNTRGSIMTSATQFVYGSSAYLNKPRQKISTLI